MLPLDGHAQAIADEHCPLGCDHATATRGLALIALAAGAISAHCQDTARDVETAWEFRALTLLLMQIAHFVSMDAGSADGEPHRRDLVDAVLDYLRDNDD